MCGEQRCTNGSHRLGKGSSPRVRGAGNHTSRIGATHGIIPACAGSRPAVAKDAKAVRDHPRVCGEQQAPWYRTPRRLGSSPRVRGAASAMRLILIFIGIIPACAGSSYHGAVAAAQARDHPRVCGEQIAKAVQTIINAGSSPRVRGAGKPCNVWDFSNGIIPACAGSSMARY